MVHCAQTPVGRGPCSFPWCAAPRPQWGRAPAPSHGALRPDPSREGPLLLPMVHCTQTPVGRGPCSFPWCTASSPQLALGLSSRRRRLPSVCSCPSPSIRHQQGSLGNKPQGWPSWAFVTDKCGRLSCLKDGASPTPTSRTLQSMAEFVHSESPSLIHSLCWFMHLSLRHADRNCHNELTKGGGGR